MGWWRLCSMNTNTYPCSKSRPVKTHRNLNMMHCCHRRVCAILDDRRFQPDIWNEKQSRKPSPMSALHERDDDNAEDPVFHMKVTADNGCTRMC